MAGPNQTEILFAEGKTHQDVILANSRGADHGATSSHDKKRIY